jgi:toxin ParE1/3/4
LGWVLTPDAVEDIDHLCAEGQSLFGRAQAVRYETELVDRFDMLAAHPYIVPAHEVDGLELRLMPSGRHHILYVVENEDVIILRVLHALQNWLDTI